MSDAVTDAVTNALTSVGAQDILMPADPAWQIAVADMAEFVAGVRRLVVLTGAGASTESGIPDFRSPNGIWARVAPTSYRAFLTSAEARRDYWRLRRELGPTVAAAQPNAVHYALAELERRGILAGILTRNYQEIARSPGRYPARLSRPRSPRPRTRSPAQGTTRRTRRTAA